jgi:uncharacterized protein (TIGR02996 family)
MSSSHTARPEVLAFLQDIKEDPHDDTPRLILADWLQENGDAEDSARGELLRLQCQAARLPSSNPRYTGLQVRQQQLFDRHGKRWLTALGVKPARCRWERGLLAVFIRQSPLLQISSRDAASEAWAWVSELYVSTTSASEISLLRGWFAHATILAHLSTLSLFDNQLGPADARALAACPHLSRLSRLVLDYNHLGDEGAIALANSANLPGLRELSLDSNHIRDTGGLALATSEYRRGLTRLSLQSNPLHRSAADELRRRFPSRVVLDGKARAGTRPDEVLGIPVTDLDLSFRSRNLLKRMQIRTVGDLTRITEDELFSGSCFGETSLREIKQLLAIMGLRLGQALP